MYNNPLNAKMIYQVFIRNHSSTGDFQGLIKDLPRIKALGCDFLYLMPIHPISKTKRKGTLGSSYAVADYFSINPEYGTINDFKTLLTKAHQLGLKVWMDIVINHTGADHYYLTQHPEYYYRKPNGQMGNKVGDWSDIVDLDFQSATLQQELLKMFEYWTRLGVDGYRCDVASMIPLTFWRKADAVVKAINPDNIWLAESIHGSFVNYLRQNNILAHSDGELYEIFDVEYDYDLHHAFMGYFKQENRLVEYKKLLAQQEYIYPEKYVKAHFLENHDQPRIHDLTKNQDKTLNWLAFSFFAKGMAFVYAGQECLATKFVDQFEACPIQWNPQPQVVELITKLKTIKQWPDLLEADQYQIDLSDNEVLVLYYRTGDEVVTGIFNVGLQSGYLSCDLPDGSYFNVFNRKVVTIHNKQLLLGSDPMILIQNKE